MSNFLNQAKEFAQDFGNNQGNSGSGSNNQGGSDNFANDAQQFVRDNLGGNNQGGSGGNNLANDAEQFARNQGGNSGSDGQQGGNFLNQAQQALGGQGDQGGQGGSGGLASQLESAGKDSYVNNEVNSFLTKEGVPQGADSTVDKFVDQEANKYL